MTSDPSGAGLQSGAGLVTPDAVPLELETATVGSRTVAYLLDLLLLGTGYLLLGLATAALGGGGFVPGWAGIAILLVLVFALQFGYPIGFETLWRGRTPGKAAMGLRVVTLEGAPVGVRHAAVRATVGLFELLMLLGVPAIVTSLVSARGQRLGDLAAGTLVLRERRATGALEVVAYPVPAGFQGYTAQLDVSGLGPADLATVRDTLRRLPSLPEDGTRGRIAEQLAGALVPRVTPPPPAGASAETWLRCVAAAVQSRRRASRVGGSSPSAGPAPASSGWPGPAAPPAPSPGPARSAPAGGPTSPDPSGPTSPDPSGPTAPDPSGPTTPDPSAPSTPADPVRRSPREGFVPPS
jgi:uncharacterized RDD family membrane protein YckC